MKIYALHVGYLQWLTIVWNKVQGLGGDTSIGVHLIQDIVEVNVVGFTYCSLMKLKVIWQVQPYEQVGVLLKKGVRF